MNILVLGVKGMLGTEFMQTLPSYHNMIAGEGIDITSTVSCNKILEINPDIVINCAAYTNVDNCEIDLKKCFDVNGFSLKNLAETCNKQDIKLIHFSTDYVFDGEQILPYKETDICNPINMYGFSKRVGEKCLLTHSTNYLLIRTSWLYGKSGKNFISAILNSARNKNILKVVNDQHGAPTYTKDLVLAVNKLLIHTGTFNVTNQGFCTWFEYAKRILQIAKIDTEIIPIKSSELDRLAKRPTNSVLDNSKYIDLKNESLRYWDAALTEYLEEIL